MIEMDVKTNSSLSLYLLGGAAGGGRGEAGGVARRHSDGVGQEVSAPRGRECEL